MLWRIAVVLIILWMLGLVTGFTMGDFTHILLFIAIIAMLIQIEDDCSDYGSDHTRKRYLKRQLISRSRKFLPKLPVLSGKMVSQPIYCTTNSPRGVTAIKKMKILLSTALCFFC